MKYFATSTACIAAVLTASCGLFIGGPAEDRREAYLNPQVVEELEVPKDLNKTTIRDLLEIPEVETLPTAQVYNRRIPRPAPLYSDDDPDIIKIQRLGDRSWVILRQTPDVVWPLVQQFMAANDLEIVKEIPHKGVLISESFAVEARKSAPPAGQNEPPITELGEEESIEVSWRGQMQAGVDSGALEAEANHVVARVEYGLRRGTSEVHFRYFNGGVEAPDIEPEGVTSSDIEIEKALVSEFASFSVRGSLARSSSILVRQLSMSERSQIVHNEAGHPVLILETDMDRAWATIRQSLRKAEIKIVDDRREEGVIEVLVSERQLRRSTGQRGLLSRLNRQRTKGLRHVAFSVQPVEGALWVETESRDGKPISVEFSERLLSLLKDLSA